jgi:hypothetical protein
MHPIVYACGTPVPRGQSAMVDHQQTEILLTNPKPFIKDRIQEKFKVEFIDGNVVVISHTFHSIKNVVRMVEDLTGAEKAVELNTTVVCRGYAATA